MLSLCMNMAFVNNANAEEANYVITSDGLVHALPAEFNDAMVAWWIDTYEDILEMKRNMDRYNGKDPVWV